MFELSQAHKNLQNAYREFALNKVAPLADAMDTEQVFSAELTQKMADSGYLGALIPTELGGSDLDMLSFGLLNEELGRVCSSTRSLITVHSMCSHAILRWGRGGQKERWLPRLASGDLIGAFALTEPKIGSNAGYIETNAVKQGDDYLLNGTKQWITFGQIADLFILFAKWEGKAVAFILEKAAPGLTITPIEGMLGTRGAMLATLHLRDCRVSAENLLGGLGFGIAGVAMSALDIGRYSVATGSLGIGQGCLDASLSYSRQRVQFGKPLNSFQLIQQMITNMVTEVQAARLLCYQAGEALQNKAPAASNMILIAKYNTSTMAMRAASDAVQIHGANGCSSDYPVQRYFRDAKVMEIIEGSNQMQQIMIARNAATAQPAPTH
ncbi:MAG TPA: acyl-CoA dehydrogenase [Anaerolineae bacterium]|nr:acyl-CoA dehydrogenase [Anaerolineae bacterium]